MAAPTDRRYELQDYIEAAKITADLANTGYDLSESERSALRKAATILRSWATSLPRK
jgi:hypothetical protein